MRRLTPLRRVGGVFVCADRIGSEGATNFCGGSCVLSGASRVTSGELIDAPALGTAEEGVLVAEVEVPVASPGDSAAAAAGGLHAEYYAAMLSSSSGGSSSAASSLHSGEEHNDEGAAAAAAGTTEEDQKGDGPA